MCERMLLFLEVLAVNRKALSNYFTRAERLLWCSSVLLITLSFCLFDRANYLTLVASIVGATSLVLNAKGNPIGQFLMVVFSLLYGVISLRFAYYGEMITYLGMTGPMALFALISWLKNPYGGNRAEVKVDQLKRGEGAVMLALTAAVTAVFFFVLRAFHTANLGVSTLSVATSFLAVYLTFRRNPYYALAYAANDLVLVALWGMASLTDPSYLSVVICFAMFLLNDLYGFVNWRRMQIRQSAAR
ncbi:nicotinamide riboside transporter PnuC [Bittarella massiliensis]|uniref:nicotinamide riboside transporter PnuC n=1 Tax=Bittarella massiliensis (ex Durand et al. 2017) TaxID=1720313 RepID=UPI00073E6CEF